MLDHDRLVANLVDRALLDTEAVVDGEVRVIDASRRHRNAHVDAGPGRSYVVKRGQQDGRGLGTVAYEAAVYDIVAGLRESLGALLPHCFGFDAATRTLVIELVAGAENAREQAMRSGTAAPSVAAAIGDALGRLHAAARRQPTTTVAQLARDRPDVFALGRPTLRMLQNASAGVAGLMRIIQQTPELAGGLAALEDAWRPTMLIHGDPRWENWLVAPAADGPPPHVTLVDWEFAVVGDPAWDVGSAVCEYLAFWVRSIPVIPGTTIDEAAFHTDVSLDAVQAAIRRLWLAYARRCVPADLDGELALVGRFAAAKLVQVAAEHAHWTTEVTAPAGALLQLAANVFGDPRRAAEELLGVPPTAEVAA